MIQPYLYVYVKTLSLLNEMFITGRQWTTARDNPPNSGVQLRIIHLNTATGGRDDEAQVNTITRVGRGTRVGSKYKSYSRKLDFKIKQEVN